MLGVDDSGERRLACSGLTATREHRSDRRLGVKGSEKPKKLQKKAAQKTLKEKRSEKKAKSQGR